MLQEVRRDVRELARAAVRRETLPGHLREAASIAVTIGLWPFGVVDRGLQGIRNWAAADDGGVATPVLLVHGYGANKSNWMFLERELRGAGFERVHAVNYNPLVSDIPEIAQAVTRRARDLMAHTGADQVHLIGHSTGGIVNRYAVQLLGLEAATCISVASPHNGSPAARFGGGRTARQLRPGSDVLRRVQASSRPLPTRFVAYYSNLDLLVPGRSAQITEPAVGAVNVLVKDEGHLSILLSRRLARSIVDQLAAAEGLPGSGMPVTALGEDRASEGASRALPVVIAGR